VINPRVAHLCMKQSDGVPLRNSSPSPAGRPTHYACVRRANAHGNTPYIRTYTYANVAGRPVRDKLSISSADTDKPHSRHQFSRTTPVVAVSTISRPSIPRTLRVTVAFTRARYVQPVIDNLFDRSHLSASPAAAAVPWRCGST